MSALKLPIAAPCSEYYRLDLEIKDRQRASVRTGDVYARPTEMQAGDAAIVLRMERCIHTLKCATCREWLRTT